LLTLEKVASESIAIPGRIDVEKLDMSGGALQEYRKEGKYKNIVYLG